MLRSDRLKALREAHGWSQRELSRRCGLAENMIGKYESDQVDPTATSLSILGDVLDVSLDYLVGTSDNPNHRIDPGDLSAEETKIIELFRREGWPGVIRFGGESLAQRNGT